MAIFISPKYNVGEKVAGGTLAIYTDDTMQQLVPLWRYHDLQQDSDGSGRIANPVPVDNNGINSSPVFFDEHEYRKAFYVLKDARGAIIRQGFAYPASWQAEGVPSEPPPSWKDLLEGKADNAGSIDAGSGSDTDTPAQENATVWGMLQKIWDRIYALANRIAGIENLGHYAGAFDNFQTPAQPGNTVLPLDTSAFPNGISVNDFVTIRSDETQGGSVTRYVVSAVNGTSITWDFDVNLGTDITGKADDNGSVQAGSGSDTSTPATASTAWDMLQTIWNRIYALATGKFNNPTGTASQYIRGDGTLAMFPEILAGFPYIYHPGLIDSLSPEITKVTGIHKANFYTSSPESSYYADCYILNLTNLNYFNNNGAWSCVQLFFYTNGAVTPPLPANYPGIYIRNVRVSVNGTATSSPWRAM